MRASVHGRAPLVPLLILPRKVTLVGIPMIKTSSSIQLRSGHKGPVSAMTGTMSKAQTPATIPP